MLVDQPRTTRAPVPARKTRAEQRSSAATTARSAARVPPRSARTASVMVKLLDSRADRAEHRQLEHVAAGRAAEALADVEEVGDDEDREDRAPRRRSGTPCRPARGRAARRLGARRRCVGRRSFVLPVRIVGMLQIPQRPAAAHHRQRREVVGGRRRGRRPLERPGVPRIVARRLARGAASTTTFTTKTAIADGLERHADRRRSGSRSPSRGPAS